MPNSIKDAGADGVALQITKPARAAGLVEEDSDGNATYRADVRVYAFDDVLLVVDRERMNTDDVAELVASVAQDTDSIYQAVDAVSTSPGTGTKCISRWRRTRGSRSGIRRRHIPRRTC